MSEIYQNYQPSHSTRKSENIEWNISYIYNRNDTASPRVLVIGDSICNAYQPKLRENLASRANLTFWASSFCVTDPMYFRLLDTVLDFPRADVVVFNNALHSFTSDEAEWLEAFRQATHLIRAKLPEAKLIVLNGTPLQSDPDGNVDRVNRNIARVAEQENLPLWDINAFCSDFPKDSWSDNYHFKLDAIALQAEFLAAKLAEVLPEAKNAVEQKSTATGPLGALK